MWCWLDLSLQREERVHWMRAKRLGNAIWKDRPKKEKKREEKRHGELAFYMWNNEGKEEGQHSFHNRFDYSKTARSVIFAEDSAYEILKKWWDCDFLFTASEMTEICAGSRNSSGRRSGSGGSESPPGFSFRTSNHGFCLFRIPRKDNNTGGRDAAGVKADLLEERSRREEGSETPQDQKLDPPLRLHTNGGSSYRRMKVVGFRIYGYISKIIPIEADSCRHKDGRPLLSKQSSYGNQGVRKQVVVLWRKEEEEKSDGEEHDWVFLPLSKWSFRTMKRRRRSMTWFFPIFNIPSPVRHIEIGPNTHCGRRKGNSRQKTSAASVRFMSDFFHFSLVLSLEK